ncbi:hypothetical protein IJS77_01735 [bacterium]|nr:hypothetical protein [bacterium]
MKKIFILITALIITVIPAFAEVYEAKYCAVPKEKETGSKLSKIISAVTGSTFTSSKAAELAIQKTIKAQLGSNVNIELYPYSLGSLIQGIFKKMTISAKSLNLGGIYVSEFDAQTVCDYNHIWVKDNNLLFKENFVMSFSGAINSDDLEKTMSNPQYLKMVESAKVTIFGQVLFKLSYMKISIVNNRLVFVANVMSPVFWGTESKKITATSGLSVVNGKIKYDNIKIQNSDLGKNLQYLLSLVNLVNPFTFEVKLSENTKGYTIIKNAIIEKNEMKIDGVLYIPKNN